MVNNFLLPVFGDENPFDISHSDEDLEVEDKLFSHFGRHIVAPGRKLAGMGKWVMNLLQEKDKTVKRVGFLTLWLSKFYSVSSPDMGFSLFSSLW